MGIIGDDRLTFREIQARIEASSSCVLSDVSVQKRLTAAFKKGLLGRIKSKEAGRIYVYFRGDRDISCVADDEIFVVNEPSTGDPFTIQVFCRSCGHERQIEFQGNSTDLGILHHNMTWGCHGCGILVHLRDSIAIYDLSQEFSTWVACQNPHEDRRPPFAYQL